MTLDTAVEDSNLLSGPSVPQKTQGLRVSYCLSQQEELQAVQPWTAQWGLPREATVSLLWALKGQREGGEGAKLWEGLAEEKGATPEFHTVGLKRQALSCLFNHGKLCPSGHPKTLSAHSPAQG